MSHASYEDDVHWGDRGNLDDECTNGKKAFILRIFWITMAKVSKFLLLCKTNSYRETVQIPTEKSDKH